MNLDEPISAYRRLNDLYEEALSNYSALIAEDPTHPDVKFWFDQMRRIATSLSKISTTEQLAANDAKVELLKTVLKDSKLLPPADKERIATALLRRYNAA